MTTIIDSRPTAQDTTDPKHSAAVPARRPGLVAALRSELVKLLTVRSYRAITILTIVVGGFASFAVARLVTDEVITVANVFGFSAVFTAVFAAVSGILAYTSEVEHSTIAQTFVAQPRRLTVVLAKTVTVASFVALLGLTGLAAGAAGAWLGGVELGDTATMPATIGWATGFATIAGILGLGIGLIARQSAAAISGLLVWWLVVESLVSVFAPERYARFLPYVAGNGMLGIVDEGELVAFSRPVNALIFGGYALAALVIGAAVVHRTDP
jgi:hypothetical protein